MIGASQFSAASRAFSAYSETGVVSTSISGPFFEAFCEARFAAVSSASKFEWCSTTFASPKISRKIAAVCSIMLV